MTLMLTRRELRPRVLRVHRSTPQQKLLHDEVLLEEEEKMLETEAAKTIAAVELAERRRAERNYLHLYVRVHSALPFGDFESDKHSLSHLNTW